MKLKYLGYLFCFVSFQACTSRVNNEKAEVAAAPVSCDNPSMQLESIKAWEPRLDYLYGCVQQSVYPPNKRPDFRVTDVFSGPKLFDPKNLRVSFDTSSDVMPAGRKKLIHSFGSVAKVEFVKVGNNHYTGIFKGAYGLARLSLAGNAKLLGFVPGMGLKFPIENRPSSNLMVMKSVDGQGKNANFFENSFSNRIPTATSFGQKQLAKAFAKAKNDGNPNRLSIDHFAEVAQSGAGEAAPSFPENLLFVPNKELAWDAAEKTDFRDKFAAIPVGAKLYDVFAADTELNPKEKIGELYLRSRLLASQFGDDVLFFQHHQK